MLIRLIDRMPAPIARHFRSDSRLAGMARPLLNRFVPDGETVVSIRSGPGEGLLLPIKLKSEKFYWTGAHEQHVQDALARELKPGMTYWDVGSHIGFLAVMAGRLVGDSGKVVAFEPMPDTLPRLQRSIDLNHLDNVQVMDCAIADTNGPMTLHPPLVHDTGDGDVDASQPSLMWTLVEDLGEKDGVTVQCRRLDDVAAELGSPDLVKIDAEGAEVDVLAGGLELMAAGKTRVIIEISDEATLARAKALLPDHGFQLLGANHWLVG